VIAADRDMGVSGPLCAAAECKQADSRHYGGDRPRVDSDLLMGNGTAPTQSSKAGALLRCRSGR
jgi:hypothetical protein